MHQVCESEQGSLSALGFVSSVKGSRVIVTLLSPVGTEVGQHGRTTVGTFLTIRIASSRLVGMVTEVTSNVESGLARLRSAAIDLIGELREVPGTPPFFVRGLLTYPSLGDEATLLTQAEVRTIFTMPNASTIGIGHLYQDEKIEARLDVDRLLQRHFAILGSTGVGKSSGVAVLLREILATRDDLHVFTIDCHNEYGRCFGDLANVISPRTSRLPFWLFNFEEIVDVIFGGRAGIDEEIEILAELIPLAKVRYLQYKAVSERLALRRADRRSVGYTVDTPVPYLLQDLIALIDERMGKLENRAMRMHHHRLTSRLEAISGDSRYEFMFGNANVGGDIMAELLNQLFRIEACGKPITVMQIAGLPAEVTDAVVSVLCRLAFDFGMWSDGAVPLLFVCEEAHRYASADHSVAFGPTRRALARIAKEGRKYGVYLGLITQRPAELDPTILSQCATILAMRTANERDQALLRSAVSDAAADLLAFLPTLGTREVIAFGEAVALPARMTFKHVPAEALPQSDVARPFTRRGADRTDLDFVHGVVDRWRRCSTDKEPAGEAQEPAAPESAATAGAGTGGAGTAGAATSSPVSANRRLDQARMQLLKR